jgi:hypothetical protein
MFDMNTRSWNLIKQKFLQSGDTLETYAVLNLTNLTTEQVKHFFDEALTSWRNHGEIWISWCVSITDCWSSGIKLSRPDLQPAGFMSKPFVSSRVQPNDPNSVLNALKELVRPIVQGPQKKVSHLHGQNGYFFMVYCRSHKLFL